MKDQPQDTGRIQPVSASIPIMPDTEARMFKAALTASEWILHGRRHRAFVLLSGSGRIVLERTHAPLVGPCIVWLPVGNLATLKLDAGSEGASLTVSELSLGRAIPAGPVGAQIREAMLDPALGTRVALETARKLGGMIEAIEIELREDAPGAHDAVRQHIALLLIALWRLSSPSAAKPQPSPRATVHGFLHLVEIHVRDHWTVADYARLLGVTADRLNSAIRRATGRSPLALIHARLITEAEILLDSSTLQVSEVAEALGFRDPAYFNRFFKRLTGIAPGRRRFQPFQKIPRADQSFAAWP
ncbi:helix-turn-helix domain-containing protein [Mesorhizobium sp. CGMCC 1.15528]|uniref:Helix-turn-helix domain-containing protein n=1 Tax=Mesorhizobium zhangyense TaxID=1776730 RepID=A0A7C9R6D8_9HYPH|nr:helix-turn-helix domain-containing protein [Mesorhizobium zhangyense]NGN41155.1 helix-turn-helix domain-containing protein [Mesorhizobium zhangyense]